MYVYIYIYRERDIVQYIMLDCISGRQAPGCGQMESTLMGPLQK